MEPRPGSFFTAVLRPPPLKGNPTPSVSEAGARGKRKGPSPPQVSGLGKALGTRGAGCRVRLCPPCGLGAC